MKKLFSLICGSMIALSLFTVSGKPVMAAETTETCACHDVTPILGAERNKIVASLISNQEFKDSKFALKSDGYTWRGANNIEVMVSSKDDRVFIGVPYFDKYGNIVMAVFVNGVFVGNAPM